MGSKLFIGTSGWAYKDWKNVFYPQSLKASAYLKFYSQHFNSVEVDSTFYGIPRISTVQNWFKQTPPDFVFSLKVPQTITHEKRLQNCDLEWQTFLEVISILEHKRGPLILQFDYKFDFKTFFHPLKRFLQQHDSNVRLAVEIRHKSWHQASFYQMLKDYKVALILQDLYYMPRLLEVTTDFTLIRLLGNRKQITNDFSQVRVQRTKDLAWWAERIKRFLEQDLTVYVYSNNHYQGHAPDTIRSLLNRLKQK